MRRYQERTRRYRKQLYQYIKFVLVVLHCVSIEEIRHIVKFLCKIVQFLCKIYQYIKFVLVVFTL